MALTEAGNWMPVLVGIRMKDGVNMLSRKQIDATQGALLPQILRYSIPVLLSTLVQNLFSSIDIAVLGNFANTSAVASMGATSSVNKVLIYLFTGIATGAGVVLARAIGARDTDKARRIVDTSMIFAFIGGLCLAVVGWILAPFIMKWTGCPADCYDGAVLYIRIYLSAAPAILLQNFGCTILNTSGNTQSPLYFMLIGGTMKVVLNILLCLALPNKVLAVALATAASQILWAVLAVRRLCSGRDSVQLHLRELRFDTGVLKQLLAQGIPVSLYQILFPLSDLQIQSAVNSFGSVVVAANSAASSVESIVYAFVVSLGSACRVFVGQNLGAEKPDRVRRSIATCIGINLVVTSLLGISFYASGHFWLNLLLPDSPASIEFAMIRMGFLTRNYVICGINGILGPALQAFGYSTLNSLNSILFVLVFRVGWMTFVYPRYQSYTCLIACFIVSWFLLMVTNVTMNLIVLRRYRKGIYRRL